LYLCIQDSSSRLATERGPPGRGAQRPLRRQAATASAWEVPPRGIEREVLRLCRAARSRRGHDT
jgi:hypothetical protein